MIVLVVRASVLHLNVCGYFFQTLFPLLERGVSPILLVCGLLIYILATGVCKILDGLLRTQRQDVEKLFRLARSLPGVRNLVARSKEKILSEVESGLKSGVLPVHRTQDLPCEGQSIHEILKQADKLKGHDCKHLFHTSKMTGTVYATELTHRELCNSMYCNFAHTNPLHGDAFPSVARMESEVVSMTSMLVSNDSNSEICGAVTSGGTESILTAIRASRDFMCYSKHISRPEMIVSVSAHAAVYKAAEYFKINIVRVPTDEHGQMNVAAVKRALSRRTILIYASAPTYPHGVIDPIEELSDIALGQRCCLHVDACLGGFILPFLSGREIESHVPKFDFSLAGVTSMSLDTHKYGYAQKGSSVVLYSTSVLRQFQYTSVADWTGGLYISPTPAGSRSGGLIAQTWAAMLHMGREGYSRVAHEIIESAIKLRKAVADTDGLELIGRHATMVVAWRTTDRTNNVYVLNDILSSKGWRLAVLQNPSALHFCITPANISSVDALIDDLKQAVQTSRTLDKIPGGKAPIYGLAHGLPDRGVVKELLRDIQDLMLQNV